MSSLKMVLVLALVGLDCFPAAGQMTDELAATQVLGTQWQETARSAGMIFSGTVLNIASQTANGGSVPTVEVKFKVDRAIAGVRAGKVLTIREWSGALSLHRPMRAGDHLLLLLYPPSRLGLTSPVNGPLGQIALDHAGKLSHLRNISERQLERAIRSARGE